MINKPVKSITPIKSINTQRSARGDQSLTTREKALMKQNVELKKENAELIRLLKKSKEVIREELGKSKHENQIMKKFIETVWPIVDSKIEGGIKEEVKTIISFRDSGKMNTITTNHTDNISGEQQSERSLKDKQLEQKLKSDREELEHMKQKLLAKEAQARVMQQERDGFRQENESMKNYLRFSKNAALPTRKSEGKEILPVDSANVGSEADEDGEDWCGKKSGNHSLIGTLPGFIKSMMMKI